MTDEPYIGKPAYSPEHAEALALCESEWMPPKAVSLSALQQQPRLPLMSVLNFLAFNAPEPPADYSHLERAAYLERAWGALCAAAREDKVRLVGMLRGSQIRQRIESVEFDLNLLLGGEDGTIGNLEAMLPHQQSDHGVFWRDVYVERSFLVDWLNKMLAMTRRSAKADRVKRCQEWLVKLCGSGPKEYPKNHYKEEAMKKFAVGPDQFKTAWKNATFNTDWGNPGARKKK